MEISRQFVRQKNPCTDGFRWFMRHFQEGADYQPLLVRSWQPGGFRMPAG